MIVCLLNRHWDPTQAPPFAAMTSFNSEVSELLFPVGPSSRWRHRQSCAWAKRVCILYCSGRRTHGPQMALERRRSSCRRDCRRRDSAVSSHQRARRGGGLGMTRAPAALAHTRIDASHLLIVRVLWDVCEHGTARWSHTDLRALELQCLVLHRAKTRLFL